MGRRHGLLVAIVIATALIAFGSAAPAGALTKARATRIALAALKPAKVNTGTGVVVYRLPRALRARDRVDEFHPVRHLKLGKRLGRRTWLFWEDLAPGALFAHESFIVLVDDKTGRVKAQAVAWWPLVNGKPPAFFNRKPPRGDVVFDSRHKGGRRATAPVPASWRQASAPLQIGAKQLAHDCLVTVGLEKANVIIQRGNRREAVRPLREDFAGIRSWADSVGLDRYDGGDNATSLSREVTSAVNLGCKDVFIFLGGHGVPPPGMWKEGTKSVEGAGGPPAVLTRAQYVPPDRDHPARVDSKTITPADIARVMAEHDNTKPVDQRATFKVKIVACFAARFADTLDRASNLQFSEYSSAADETSFFHLPGAEVERDGKTEFVENKTDNPHGVSEFMNRNIHGLDTWARSQQARNVPDLANGLTNAFDYGKPFDFADSVGWTHAVKRYNPGAVNVTFPPPPQPLQVKIVNPGYDHTTPGNPASKYPSTVCFDITTDPLQAGAEWTVVITPDGRTVKGRLDANGHAFVVLGIPQYGSYRVIAGVGDAKTGDADAVTIDAPQPNPNAQPPVPSSTRSCKGATPQ
jgi:hypothetical protein